jgi:hypothetical protein
MAKLRPFGDLGCISKATLGVLSSLGFETATPVQEATIPLFCGHKDVAVDACTGSGKTLAFVVPVIEKLRKREEKLKQHQVHMGSRMLTNWSIIVDHALHSSSTHSIASMQHLAGCRHHTQGICLFLIVQRLVAIEFRSRLQ